MSKTPQGTRGAGFGLDAELARKQAAKYDPNAERMARVWLEAVTGETLQGDFGPALKNGQILCKLINTIKPGSVRKIETSAMPFKQMENISNFLRACRTVGIAEYELFETVDLFEEKDLGVVVTCLHALSRAVQKNVPTFNGPYLDPTFNSPRAAVAVDAAVNQVTTGVESVSLKPSVPPSPPPKPSKLNPDSGNVSQATIFRAAATPAVSAASPSTTTASSNTGVERAATGSRGAGFGLDAELAKKQAEKYDVSLENQAREWIEAVTGESFNSQPFASYLKNGEVLCKLVNAIRPGSVKKINSSAMPFKQMENISSFLRACRALGVSEHDLFETVDLFEEKDMNVVVQCIFALGRTIQRTVPEYTGPTLGPRMANAHKREFTEEQLAKARAESGMTKISAGSKDHMSRSEVSRSGSVTFGADTVGSGDSASISALNKGSIGVMDRTHVSSAGNITFGHDMSKSK